MLTRLYIAADTRIRQAVGSKDQGQGTLEYLGVIVIVAILVVAAVAAFNTFDLGGKLSEQLDKIGNAG